MKKYISAGGILLKNNNEVYMIRKIERDEWALPKGTVEEGENVLQTAIREIKEETGYSNIRPRENKPFSETNYLMKHPKTGEDIDKTVYFFIFDLLSDENENTSFMKSEGLEGKWFDIETAISFAKFYDVKKVIEKAKTLI